MKDCLWHSWKEMETVAGVRYGARLHELKRSGYQFHTISDDEPIGQKYRLISTDPGAPQGKRVKVLLKEKDVQQSLLNNLLTEGARKALQDGLGSFQHNKTKL